MTKPRLGTLGPLDLDYCWIIDYSAISDLRLDIEIGEGPRPELDNYIKIDSSI